MSREQPYEKLSIPCKTRSEVVKLWLDVQGHHCLIVMSNLEHYYLNLFMDDVVPLHNITDMEITAVALNSNTSQRSTGDILLALKDGSIYQYSIEIDLNMEVVESTPKKVYQLPTNVPIYGLVYETYEYQPKGEKKSVSSTLVMAVTNESSYQFSGILPFDKLFDKYSGKLSELNKNKKSVAKGKIEESELQLFYLHKGKGDFELHSFAWKCGVGIAFGNFRRKADTHLRVIVKDITIEEYKKKGQADPEIPEAVGITEHSLYYLYVNNLTIVSRITMEIQHCERFRPDEVMRKMIYDSSANSLWLHSVKGVYRLMVTSSDKDLWKEQLENENYEKAFEMCKEADPSYIGYVAGLYADAMFKNTKYVEAAQLYAQSTKSFEEVIMRYLSVGETEGLEFYLMNRLECIPESKKLRQQRVILSTWLLELMLDNLNKLETAAEGELPENASPLQKTQKDEAVESYTITLNKFKLFLKEHEHDLDSETVFQLLQSHGRLLDCLHFATQKKNYEAIVVHHINTRNFRKALEVLTDIKDDKIKFPMMIKYGSIFMKQEPKSAIESLLLGFKNINID